MKKTRILFCIIIISILIFIIGGTIVNSMQVVSLQTRQQPVIDIVLTKNQSKVDISNFEKDLKAELEKQNIDPEKVNVQEIQTEDFSSNSADAADILNNWGRVGYPGDWHYSGNEVINRENTNDLTGFYYPDNFGFDDIDFSYENMSDNSDDDIMGSMFRFNVNENGTVTTYLLLLNKRDNSGGFNYENGLYKITNNQFSLSNLQLLQKTNATWTRNTWSKYHILAKGNNIKVYQNDNLIIDYTDPDPIYTGSYGIFSCSQPYARYRNIGLTVTNYKNFLEVLQQAKWKDDALRLIVNVEDKINKDLEDEGVLSQAISRFLSQDIHYVGWGTSENAEQIQNIVNKNDNKGTFIENINYEQAIQETVKYIKSLLESYPTNQNLIINEPIDMQVTPENLKNNTINAAYPNGRWKAIHNENFYENSNGKYINSGNFQDAIMEEFENVGKYDIYFENQLIKELYLHRRPIAIITSKIENGKITLSSEKSYDLDRQSAYNGISEEKWFYKKVEDKEWTEGKLETIQEGENYLVKLIVKDHQDTWSKDAVQYISTSATKPIAQFEVVKSEITVYENLQLIDTSYDPVGKAIVEHNWKLYKGKDEIYSGQEAPVNYQQYGEGTYRIVLKVKNVDGLESDAFEREITVQEDKIAPKVHVEPSEQRNMHENISVNLSFIDIGGSGFKSYKYAITNDKNANVEYSDWINNINDTIKINQSGANYLHIKTVDNAGNESEDLVFGPYTIEEERIPIQINAVDKEDNSVKLGGLQFEIVEPKVNEQEEDKRINYETDENGKADGLIDVMKTNGKYTYILKEVNTPSSYNSIGETSLTVDIQNGKIVFINSSNPNVQAEITADYKINIICKYAKVEKPFYNFVIHTIDKNSESIKVKDAKYNVEVYSNNSEIIKKELVTNQDGIAQIDKLAGSGEISFVINQIATNNGYKIQGNEIVVTINRDKNTNKISGVANKTSKNAEVYIDNKRQEISLVIANDKKVEKNAIRIELIGEANENLENIKVKLEQPLDLGIIEATTNTEGLANIDKIQYPGEGEFSYIIKGDSNNIYEFPDVKLPVTFKNKLIKSVKQYENAQVIKEENDEEVIHTLHVKIKAKLKEEYKITQQFKIKKENLQAELLPGIMYRVTIKSDNFVKTIKTQTDKNGEISVPLWNSEKLEITVKELKTLEGYKLDPTEKKIVLVKGENNQYNINTEESAKNVTKDEVTGDIILKEINEKKAESIEKANICFFLTKKDKLGNLLGNTEFKLRAEYGDNRSKEYILKTDENGYVELHDFKVKELGKYTFYIQELSPVPGYEIISEPIQLRVDYEQNDKGEIKTSTILVEKGYRDIEYKRCDEYETDENYQLDVHMTIIDKFKKPNYKIEFEKIGAKNEILTKTEFEVILKYDNGGSVKTKGNAKEIAQFFSNLNIPNGNIEVKIIETKAEPGYQLDSTPKVGILKNTGKGLEIVEDKSNIFKEDNKNIKIQIQNSLINSNGDGSNITDVEDTYFALEVINENIHNDKASIIGSKFNAKLIQNGTIIMNRTRGIGNIGNKSIFEYIFASGDLKFEITQTKAPLHHKINNKTYVVSFNRDKNTEKIVIDEKNTDEELEVEIDEVNHKIIVTIKNELAYLTMGIITVDKTDTSLRLANAGFYVSKYRDPSSEDYKTYGYGVTDNTGTVMIPMYTYITNGSAIYEVNQKKAPTGYYAQEEIGLNITTDKEGNITNAKLHQDDIYLPGECKINKIEGNYIEIIVENERKPEPTYKVIIEPYNKYNPIISIDDVKFDVEIKQEIGTNLRTIATSSGGNATINGLTGQGEIQINLQEISIPNQYLLDTQIRTVFVNREIKQQVSSQGGNVYYKKLQLSDKTDKNVEVTVNNTKQEICIRIPCIPKAGIEINKVGSVDNDIKLEKVEFGIYKGKQLVGNLNTDNRGRAFFSFGSIIPNSTEVYTIKEVKTQDGYKLLPEDIEITVIYDSKGNVQEAYITKGKEYASVQKYNNQPNIKLTIENKEEEGNGSGDDHKRKDITLKIEKQTTENKNIKVEGVTFQIRAESEDGKVLNAIKKTDKKGEINLNRIPGKGKIKITLKEIATNDNYTLDEKERVIILVREKNEDGEEEVKFIAEESAKDINIYFDDNAWELGVRIPNEISDRVIGFAIFKEDSEDELKLLKASFKIKDKETNTEYDVLADGGEGGLIGLPLKDKGTYQYEITEIQQPNGYQKINDPIILQVTYRQLGEIEKAEIIKGGEICRIDNQTDNYIELHIKNVPSDSEILPYDIKVVKVDIDDIEITLPGAELDIQVKNEIGMTNLSKQAITDQNGEIWIKNIKGSGKINIDIEEIVPPPGRKFDTKPKQVEINCDQETGRLKLVDSTNVDTIIDNNKRLVTVLVRNELGDGLYEIVLNKKDKNNSNISLQNVHMKVKMPGEKVARELVTDVKGRIVIANLIMPTAGEYEYIVEEIKTQDGYKLIDKPMKFKIQFANKNGKTYIQSVKKVTDSNNVEVSKVSDNCVLVNVLNEHRENLPTENLYKIKLKKVDKEKTNIGISNVKIKISIKQNDGQSKQAVVYTDANGEILLDNLVITDNGKIIIEEIETPKGYDLDSTPKEIQYIIKNGKIVLTKIDDSIIANTSGSQVDITVKNNANGETTDLHPEKFVSKINNQEVSGTEPTIIKQPDGSIVYQSSNIIHNVKYNDIIEYTIRIYNSGLESGYAGYIFDKVPDGLKFIEDNEINKQYKWEKVDGGYKTTILASGKENEIQGYDKNTMQQPDYKEVKIVFQVIEKIETQNPSTKNIVIVGKNEEEQKEPGRYEEDNESDSEVNVQYVKLETNKYVTSVKLNGEDKKVDIQKTESGDIYKIEIVGRKIKNSTVIVQYQIEVSNKGTKEGMVNEIKDYIPENMVFLEKENPGWIKKENYVYIPINQTLKPGEKLTRTITLRWYGNKNEMGLISNMAITNGEENISPNQQDKADITISVKTGIITNIVLVIIALVIISGGTYFIKKYVIVNEDKQK